MTIAATITTTAQSEAPDTIWNSVWVCHENTPYYIYDTGCIVGINNGGTVTNNHYDKQMCGGK